MSKFNPNHLKPGDPVNTLAGPAEYVRHKENNFRNQNHQIKYPNGSTRWYTALQLQQANREEVQV